ncbi:efflux RND transporter permease subunit [Legionella sp. CNM-4043-24]|uniref:efflux RND transporter permease subunit n=1 Tax=Legionella sp. CNM-4043-24 TaxID=3421646 RepID=UPI00403AF4A9
MLNLAKLAVQKKQTSCFLVFMLFVAGCFSFLTLGQLEDPEFTVKTAIVTTAYPGASAEQVELEVTDPIEKKIQELSEVKDISSISRPGLSIIKINIKSEYWSDRLPQVWNSLRNKVQDASPQLPPGVSAPVVGDDFGNVFGFLLAVSSDGFTYKELEHYTKELQKELSVVPGVARVDLWGVQQKRIYLDINNTQYAEMGVSPADLQRTLSLQNQVVDAGSADHQQQRLRIAPTGEFHSAEAIGNLTITPLVAGLGPKNNSELLRIRDFATVWEGYQDPPQQIMRYSGRPAIGIAIAPLAGVNSVKVGRDITRRLNELRAGLPHGIDVQKISWQSDIVAESINSFMINLLEAIVIVLAVLTLTMGIRSGLIIGISGLILAILGTFIVMKILGIDLQRVSLGALIIAMGGAVDNSIVVVDGFITRITQGEPREQAAIDSAQHSAWPLFASTIVASMAFYPIFASTNDTGEYAGSLFTVVITASLLSWILSQTITPLMCLAFIPNPEKTENGKTAYNGRFYRVFKGLLSRAIHYRYAFSVIMFVLLAFSFYGFRFVPIMFFPDSSRLQLTIDYWAPEATRIQQVSKDLEILEQKLLKDPGVTSVSTFIGQGPPRFYLPVESEFPYSSFAQLVVNTRNLSDIDRLIDTIPAWSKTQFPSAMVRARKYSVGAFNNWKISARFSGPANASPEVLRDLAEQGMAILRNNPNATDVRSDWREPVLQITPDYQEERGRWAGISRPDLAQAFRRAYDGVQLGLYREGDSLIPIIMRQPQNDRVKAAVDLALIQVSSLLNRNTIPAIQVLDGIRLQWVNPIIWRWDRKRAITVQASPLSVTANTLRDAILPEFEKIKLPPGYTLTWDGEYKSSRESQQALIPGLFPAVLVMLIMIVLLFNSYRPLLIILGVIPFVMIGITTGLIITQAPFGFIALLGAMSLSGMMIKNSVVLLDQVKANQLAGMTMYQSVFSAAVSRLRPVVNSSATTILGVIPLLQDIFWVSLAVTIMFGLAFGAILTMFLVPAFYCILYRIKPPEKGTQT